jgi:hypothetical protein
MIAEVLPAFRESITLYPLHPAGILRLAHRTLRTKFGARPPREMASLTVVLLALAAQGCAEDAPSPSSVLAAVGGAAAAHGASPARAAQAAAEGASSTPPEKISEHELEDVLSDSDQASSLSSHVLNAVRAAQAEATRHL